MSTVVEVLKSIPLYIFEQILKILYLIWLAGASLLNLIEQIFFIFVGIQPTATPPPTVDQAGNPVIGVNSPWGDDIVARVFSNRATQEIFFGMVAFATVITKDIFRIIQIDTLEKSRAF